MLRFHDHTYPFILGLIGATALTAPAARAADRSAAHQEIEQSVSAHAATFGATSRKIWEYAELGYHEDKSSRLLQDDLRQAGFKVESGVAEEPTAFIATYGTGQPVIAILGEFDALPGLSQDTVPERKPLTMFGPGHGCGHNLLGAGAALAAVALREYMERNHVAGTLRYYGTPAEEGGSGKAYMVRAGLFKDVDVVLHWHPSDRNGVINGGRLAIISAKFDFHGVAAHAALAPDRGRSALDAVMLMGNGVEFMREHIPSNSRVHYIVSKGGVAPNVVPDLAELYLMARNPSSVTLNNIWNRIVKIGQGAALMTETTLDVRIINNDSNIVANDVLAAVAQRDLEEVGGYTYTPEERVFAAQLQKSLEDGLAGDLDSTARVSPLRPIDPNTPDASTDTGNVSWNVPTIGFFGATFVPGVSAHTWQAAACAGMSIGRDGMLVAARAMAITGADLFADPKVVAEAHVEFKRQLHGRTYESLIPENQKPPLNYRSS